MNKKFIVGIMFAFLFVIPLGVAAVSVTPGSTTTVFGIPVTQNFTGLTASTAYGVTDYTGTNSTVTFNSDSDGKASVTLTPSTYGQNSYALHLGASGADVALFSVENMDIMPYIVILITISILFGVLRMFTSKNIF